MTKKTYNSKGSYTEETSWPDVRRSIFEMDQGSRTGEGSTFSAIYFGKLNYRTLGDQYKRTADIVVESVRIGGIDLNLNPHGLFMPVCYLYRHSLELILKGLFELLIECDFYNNTNTEEVFGRHNIIDIWKIIKPILIDHWSDSDPKPLNNVESLITDFHRIDKSGQALRYSKFKNGKYVRKKFPEFVNLELLKDAFDEIHSFFSGTITEFLFISDYIAEERAYTISLRKERTVIIDTNNGRI